MTLTDQEWLFIKRASPPGSLLEKAATDVLESRFMHAIALQYRAEQMRDQYADAQERTTEVGVQ